MAEIGASSRIQPLDTRRILEVLGAHGVDFVLIGGIACLVHGSSRVTVDADVVADDRGDNLDRLLAALWDLGAAVLVGAERMAIEDGDPWEVIALRQGPGGLNEAEAWHFTTDAGPLDVVFRAAGVGGYHDHLPAAERRRVFGIEVTVAGLDDLIRSKEGLARERDLAVLSELRELRRQRGS